jgi:GGDEF domain-containing protein
MTTAETLANLSLAQATVTTLASIMIVSLGFLPRPSRAALLWSLAFLLAMASTWTSVVGVAIGEESLRRVGLGLILGAPALVWSGFRARRGVRALPWVGAVQGVCSAAVLVFAVDASAYGLLFRLAFLGAAVFAGLTIFELRRSADIRERLMLPLLVVSAGFVMLALASIVSAIAAPAAVGDLQLPRLLNGLAMLIYLVCATVSLLYFTSVSPGYALTATEWPQFAVTASDRLVRARRAGESGWVALSIQVDDPAHLRSAAGDNAWSRIISAFEAVVTEAFPAEADIGRKAAGHLIVLVSRPDPVVREYVRTVLRRFTEMDATSWIAVQLSASVGWVPAEAADHDFDALVDQADAAAAAARQRGGDRWERVRV